jgi:hypothetical protein
MAFYSIILNNPVQVQIRVSQIINWKQNSTRVLKMKATQCARWEFKYSGRVLWFSCHSLLGCLPLGICGGVRGSRAPTRGCAWRDGSQASALDPQQSASTKVPAYRYWAIRPHHSSCINHELSSSRVCLFSPHESCFFVYKSNRFFRSTKWSQTYCGQKTKLASSIFCTVSKANTVNYFDYFVLSWNSCRSIFLRFQWYL